MLRTPKKIITAHRQSEGGGFIVRRPFPTNGLDMVDPFLLLDEMGPADYAPGKAVGAPDHPHRGFETVTYMLAGEFTHEDSAGHKGTLRPGDVQWMTAGAGVVHSELPSERIMKEGGRVHGFQLWVNLPARDKMIAPRYQEVSAASIPKAHSEDGKAHAAVIAGEALGVSAVIDTHTPIIYHDWTLQPGADVTTKVAGEINVFAYVFEGEALVGGEKLTEGQVAFLGDGDEVQLGAPEGAAQPARLLLIGGKPLGEPVARYGPFVMNTADEIVQAVRDFQDGKLGEIVR
ncbi:MAG: pirin family protein [Planctomycetes bacterium]|nr:pirin family protein [Planctomycetota bacterium]